jgi:hypothetical protein
MKTVYTAFSKHNFFARNLITAFCLEEGVCPLNPFTNWGYFLDDMVERDTIKRANDHFVVLADETWVFGAIADGVWHEIGIARKYKKKVHYFTVGKKLTDIREIDTSEICFERELIDRLGEEAARKIM